MKYLLLGGSGFIGTHLSNRLLADGHTVTVVDACFTSSPPKNNVNFINEDINTLNIGAFMMLYEADGLQNSIGNTHSWLSETFGSLILK